MAKEQEQSKGLQKLNRRLDFARWVALAGGILGVLGSVLAGIILPSESFMTKRERHLRDALNQVEADGKWLGEMLRRTEEENRLLSRDIAQATQKLKVLEATLETGQVQEDSGKLGRELAKTREAMEVVITRSQKAEIQIRQFDARLAKLEDVILADPEKAVSLPLLRRDIKALEQQASKDVESMRAENARVYDLMKWLIGLMALVSLSLIGTAASNVFKREVVKEEAKIRPRSPETSQTEEAT